MNTFRQGMAAVGLVATLGLIVPSALGGSAAADISHNPNHDLTPFELTCDLDGDSNGDTTYVPSHYETTYTFVSTANSKALHDQNSNTVLTQRERIDVLQAEYSAQTPGVTSFIDTNVEWFDVFEAPNVYPHGKPKGRKTVRCINIAAPYKYTASADDVKLEPRLVEGATYLETDYQLYEAMLSASGKVTAQAHHSHKHRG